jgi:hypothetical protein
MFRKCMLATAGIILGVTTVTPGRAADLPDSGGRVYQGYRATACLGFYNGLPVSFGYGLCYRNELVATPWGPRWHLVNHCC